MRPEDEAAPAPTGAVPEPPAPDPEPAPAAPVGSLVVDEHDRYGVVVGYQDDGQPRVSLLPTPGVYGTVLTVLR